MPYSATQDYEEAKRRTIDARRTFDEALEELITCQRLEAMAKMAASMLAPETEVVS